MATNLEIANMPGNELAKFASYEWEGLQDERSSQALIAAMARRIAQLETCINEINDKLRAVNRDAHEVDKQLDRLEKKADRHDANLRELFKDRI